MPSVLLTGCAGRGCRRLEPWPPLAPFPWLSMHIIRGRLLAAPRWQLRVNCVAGADTSARPPITSSAGEGKIDERGRSRTRAPHQIAMGSRSWNAVVLPTFAVIGQDRPSAERPTANKAGAEGSKDL